MFIFGEGQRAYLPAWEYNTCRVLGKLAEIVENNGGKVRPSCHIMANNRTYEPDTEPVCIYGQGYINFALDGVLYSFSVNSNPYFEHCYGKRKIRDDGKVLRNVYHEELPREAWMYDCLFSIATDDDVEFVAHCVYDALLSANMSKVYRETHKQRVANTYDGKWHWEYVTEPDKYDEAMKGW